MVGIDKLVFLRQHYGLRQKDIADYLGISVSYIKQIETYRMDISQELHDKWLEACRIRHIAQPKPEEPKKKKGVKKRGKKSSKVE